MAQKNHSFLKQLHHYKKLAMLIIFSIVLAAVVGCQKSPEANAVQGKNPDNFKNIIQETQSVAQLEQAWPSSIQDEIKDKNLTVYIDAKVEAPTVPLPISKANPFTFTHEQADLILQTLIGDSKLYDSDAFTKDDLIRRISELKEIIKGNETTEKTENAQAELESYENALANNTVAEQASEVPRTFQSNQANTLSEEEISKLTPEEQDNIMKQAEIATISGDVQYIKGIATLASGSKATIDITNSADGINNSVSFAKLPSLVVIPEKISISQDSVIEKVKETLSQMGLDHLQLKDCVLINNEANYSNMSAMDGDFYQLIFTPVINGVSETYVNDIIEIMNPQPAGENADEDQEYDLSLSEEYVRVIYNNSGLVSLDWRGISSIGDIINENVAVMPFEDIMNIFKKQIVTQNVFLDESIEAAELHINKITLGLMKIKRPNSENYIYAPVWNFFGYTNHTYKSGDNQLILDENGKAVWWNYGESFMAINALDGTIIN